LRRGLFWQVGAAAVMTGFGSSSDGSAAVMTAGCLVCGCWFAEASVLFPVFVSAAVRLFRGCWFRFW